MSKKHNLVSVRLIKKLYKYKVKQTKSLKKKNSF